MPKFYFQSKDSELCYPLEYHMEKCIGTTIELFEAVPTKFDGMMYCKKFESVGEDGNCGRICDGYEPRNGRSGMCKHRSNTMYECGEKVTFKRD